MAGGEYMKAYNTPTVEVIGTIADLTNGESNTPVWEGSDTAQAA
jgi:hypothetical protein